MQEGAFVIIDSLGFKGIWRKEDPAKVISKFREIASTVKDQIHSPNTTQFLDSGVYIDSNEIRPSVGFFSDTVFIGLQTNNSKTEISKDEQFLEGYFLVDTLSRIAIKILQLFIENEPRLTMRGCLTYDKFFSEGDFYAGPAVDTAAEYMDIAEGAFVWLHKSASYFIDQAYKELEELDSKNRAEHSFLLTPEESKSIHSINWIKYEMPIKSFNPLECYILNPLANYRTKNERLQIVEIYRQKMESDRIDISIKQQNTQTFLRKATDLSETYERASFKLNVLSDPVLRGRTMGHSKN